jgi:hypothetical protein
VRPLLLESEDDRRRSAAAHARRAERLKKRAEAEGVSPAAPDAGSF